MHLLRSTHRAPGACPFRTPGPLRRRRIPLDRRIPFHRRILSAVVLVTVVLGVAAPARAHVRAERMGALVRRAYPGAGVAPGMEAAIRATWPVRLHRQALDVAWCESSGDPTARNGQYRGHFQMGRAEWERYGAGDPYDAEDNAAAAYRYFVAVGGSWRPWQCRPVRG